jgi:hypothetical protein
MRRAAVCCRGGFHVKLDAMNFCGENVNNKNKAEILIQTTERTDFEVSVYKNRPLNIRRVGVIVSFSLAATHLHFATKLSCRPDFPSANWYRIDR